MGEKRAFITGCSGSKLTESEKRFFNETQPWGFILFKRNIETPDQLRALTAELNEAVEADDIIIFVDQEGGRVQRLGPPHWPKYPEGRRYGNLFDRDEEAALRFAYLGGYLIGDDLISVGINADCLPVLDVPVAGAHDVIGDRAYHTDPAIIAKLARTQSQGLSDAGVLPVIKHIPGHGRAGVDSHHDLPVVDTSRELLAKTDFAPFKALNDYPMAMTAHVVYEALDKERPCSTSPTVIQDIIRTEIGFDGLLMSDDVSMNALAGEIGERTEACFAAGCDFVLHCNGKLVEMEAVADKTPILTGKALERADAVSNWQGKKPHLDVEALRAEFEALLSSV